MLYTFYCTEASLGQLRQFKLFFLVSYYFLFFFLPWVGCVGLGSSDWWCVLTLSRPCTADSILIIIISRPLMALSVGLIPLRPPPKVSCQSRQLGCNLYGQGFEPTSRSLSGITNMLQFYCRLRVFRFKFQYQTNERSLLFHCLNKSVMNAIFYLCLILNRVLSDLTFRVCLTR